MGGLAHIGANRRASIINISVPPHGTRVRDGSHITVHWQPGQTGRPERVTRLAFQLDVGRTALVPKVAQILSRFFQMGTTDYLRLSLGIDRVSYALKVRYV